MRIHELRAHKSGREKGEIWDCFCFSDLRGYEERRALQNGVLSLERGAELSEQLDHVRVVLCRDAAQTSKHEKADEFVSSAASAGMGEGRGLRLPQRRAVASGRAGW